MNRQSVGATLVALMVGLSGRALASERHTVPCRPAVDGTSPIRVRDCDVAKRLTEGLARSATLRQLVQRIDDLHGLVYLDVGRVFGPNTGRLFSGALHGVTKAGDFCILWVTIAPGGGDQTIAIIGHELRHVVEVLEHPEARTDADVEALFERIGERIATGVLETEAAGQTGRIVAQELRASRPHKPLPQ
jgi:hypothetical protein